MILRVLCPQCGRKMEVALHVIHEVPWMSRRCLPCDPSGKCEMVRVEVSPLSNGFGDVRNAPVDRLDI